jgi:hypothetical protein
VALDGAAVATVLTYNPPARIAAILLSMAGWILVAGAYDLAAWQVKPLGIAAGLLAGLAFAVYSIMGRAAAQRNMPAWSTLLYIFFVAAVFLLLYRVIPISRDLQHLPRIHLVRVGDVVGRFERFEGNAEAQGDFEERISLLHHVGPLCFRGRGLRAFRLTARDTQHLTGEDLIRVGDLIQLL